MSNRSHRTDTRTARERGFTLIEVIVAASLLIILCVGTIMVFSQAIKLNRGNDIRMQALTVLQKQVENYRALKYQPVNPDPLLAGHTLTTVATAVPSANGTLFDVTVSIDNDPYTDGIQTATSAPAVPEADCTFKEITIEATPHNPQSGWLADLKTRVSFRRVRLID
jgi:prepilin-type N-terminal cleavage/methylation domain-containing protein